MNGCLLVPIEGLPRSLLVIFEGDDDIEIGTSSPRLKMGSYLEFFV